MSGAAAPIPDEAQLSALEYLVVDVETTGGSARHGHRVTEIAALRVRGTGEVVEEFTTLVNPEREIPPFISRLTRITDAMVRDAPRFEQIAGPLERLLAGRIFVAHNAHFDWGFVDAELGRCRGLSPAAPLLCTVRMARRLVPEVSSRSLDALSFYFGIDNAARHRAYGDARATVVVLGRLFERLAEREVSVWGELQELLSRRRPRRPRSALPAPVQGI